MNPNMFYVMFYVMFDFSLQVKMTSAGLITFGVTLFVHLVSASVDGAAFGVNCTLRASCSLSPDMMSYHMNCGCDDVCTIFGDCCEDYIGHPTSYIEVLPNSVKNKLKCELNMYIERRYPVYVMKQCVDNFPDKDVQGKCENNQDQTPQTMEDMFDYIPVSGVDTGILYKNSFCALCNNDKSFEFWNLNISSNNSDLLGVLADDIANSNWQRLMSLKHEIQYTHPVYKGHMCKEEIAKCSSSWADEETRRACIEGPANFVYVGYTTYRNIHCAECNNVSPSNRNLGCIDGRALLHSGGPLPPPSFSILLDFNSGSVTTRRKVDGQGGSWVTEEKTMDVECEYDSVFDPFKDECRLLVCPRGFVLKNASCISATDGGATCPMVNFKHDEFDYLQNGSIYIKDMKRVYNQDEYWTDGASVLICNPDWGRIGHNITRNVTEWEEFWKYDQVQGWVTLALNIVSMIGLSLQLAIYAYFPVLRNTPGKCLMCLSGSLLLTTLLFTVGANQNEIEGLCKFIAIVLHYGFLAYFWWMNVMAFDIWRAFTMKSHSFHTGKRTISKRFLYYSLYAWLSPLLFVVLGIILEFANVDVLRPDYGKHFCWFGNPNGLLFFFALPVAIVVLSDIVFFVLTVRNIYRVTESTKSLQKSKGDKKRLGLYVKLAIIMGLTWVLGFLATLLENVVLWYIFVVLNSLQGLWICLTFICSAKVINLIRGRYGKLRISTSTSEHKTRSTVMSVSDKSGEAPHVGRHSRKDAKNSDKAVKESLLEGGNKDETNGKTEGGKDRKTTAV